MQIAGAAVIGTPSGLHAQRAQAELNKRLIESTDSLKQSLDKNNEVTGRYNEIILNLTIAMALLSVFQIFMSAFTTNFSWPIRIGFALAPIVIIVMSIGIKRNTPFKPHE